MGSLARVAGQLARSRRIVGGVFGGLIELMCTVLVQFEKGNAGGERPEDVP